MSPIFYLLFTSNLSKVKYVTVGIRCRLDDDATLVFFLLYETPPVSFAARRLLNPTVE